MKKVQVGDKVCYSKNWLRSTATLTGPIPFARGIVTAILSYAPGWAVAIVDWGKDKNEVPERINVKKLSVVTGKGIQEAE